MGEERGTDATPRALARASAVRPGRCVLGRRAGLLAASLLGLRTARGQLWASLGAGGGRAVATSPAGYPGRASSCRSLGLSWQAASRGRGADCCRGRGRSAKATRSSGGAGSWPHAPPGDVVRSEESPGDAGEGFVPLEVGAARLVLVLGDGNLSWSLAIVRALRRRSAQAKVRTERIIVTTYDTLAELRAKYSDDGIDAVRAELTSGEADAHGVVVDCLHGVDATRLADHFGTEARFDLVVWNFPHFGGIYIQRNRQLLRSFFKSVAPHVASVGSEVHVALKEGQGGTPMDRNLGPVADTWRAVENAAAAGLVLADCRPFVEPEGYVSSGRRNTSKGFWHGGALNHVFVRHDFRPEGVPRAGLYPPTFVFDISFWVLDEPAYDPASVVAACFAAESCVRACVFENEVVAAPRDERIARHELRSVVYRITYRSTEGPEWRESMVGRHNALRLAVSRKLFPAILVRGTSGEQEEFVQRLQQQAR